MGSVVAISIGVGLGLYFASTPWIEGWSQKVEAKQRSDEARKLSRENVDMAKEQALLQAPGGMERKARELGFKRIDEVKPTPQ